MLIIDASGYRSHVLAAGVFVLAQLSPLAAQAPTGTVRVQVRASATAVEDAEVIVAATTHRTDASGTTVITVAPGVVDIAVPCGCSRGSGEAPSFPFPCAARRFRLGVHASSSARDA